MTTSGGFCYRDFTYPVDSSGALCSPFCGPGEGLGMFDLIGRRAEHVRHYVIRTVTPFGKDC